MKRILAITLCSIIILFALLGCEKKLADNTGVVNSALNHFSETVGMEVTFKDRNNYTLEKLNDIWIVKGIVIIDGYEKEYAAVIQIISENYNYRINSITIDGNIYYEKLSFTEDEDREKAIEAAKKEIQNIKDGPIFSDDYDFAQSGTGGKSMVLSGIVDNEPFTIIFLFWESRENYQVDYLSIGEKTYFDRYGIDNMFLPDIQLLDHYYEEEKYSSYIRGQVKNNSTTDYNYLQIEFALYDKDDNKVGTAWTNISGLRSGETWAFSAYIFDDDFWRYEFIEITGW